MIISISRFAAANLGLVVLLACERPTELASVASIGVSPTAVELASGEVRSLTASVTSDRGTVLSDFALSWTSSDASVVSVSGNGVLRGGTVLSAERRSATVTASGGGVSASVAVTVLPAAASRVVITAPSTRLASYASMPLVAQLQAAGGEILQGRAVRWTASDTAVALVSSAGVVSARGTSGATARTVTVSAVAGSVTGSVLLSVDPAPVRAVALGVGSATLPSGAVADIAATLRDSVGAILTGRSLYWSLSDSSVATISAGGRVTARFVVGGTPVWVYVRGRAESVIDSVRLAIQPSPVDRIVPNTIALGLSVGATRQLDADLLDARQVRLAGRTVTYGTADSAIASVSSTGVVTARAAGATTIRVRSEGKEAVITVEIIRWVDVGAGDGFSCALTSDGVVYCWGENGFGQLGDGTTTRRAAPVRVSTPLRFRTLAVGTHHSCGITTDSGIACWGRNGFGQLGDSTTVQRPLPVRLPGTRTFAAVTAAGSHTCALTTHGSALCWGRNVEGALGDLTYTNRFIPVAVAGGIRFSSLAARERSTCGLDGAGRGYCWGSNGWLALGVGDYRSSANAPVPITGNVRFAAIASGSTDTGCAIALSGLAYCWGRNRDFEVGSQSTDDVVHVSQVASSVIFRGVVRAADGYACALSVTDALLCWGPNRYQRLGALPELNNRPELLAQDGPFATIAVGRDHLCGISTAGVLQCRGRGEQGALGDGTFTAQRGDFQPVIVQ